MSCVATSFPGIRGIKIIVLGEKVHYVHITQEWVL